MHPKISPRLLEIMNALPLKDGMRILEIGCGPGVMAREMSKKIDRGFVVAIDRSGKAIQQAVAGSMHEIKSGKLSFRLVAVENFQLEKNERPFDLAIAVRVGALDGRHPEIEEQALQRIARALRPEGKLYIDGGNPIQEIPLDNYR